MHYRGKLMTEESLRGPMGKGWMSEAEARQKEI